MKRITQFALFFLTLNLATSCQNSTSDNSEQLATTVADETEINRNADTRLVNTDNAQAIDRFSLANIKIDLAAMETIAMEKLSIEDADAAAVMSINHALMSAEKEAQQLDVKFLMSEEPIETGAFVFGIESTDAKNLTLEMFDEEGYAMVAHNKFDIKSGNNYKALNVESMEDGAYIFRLKDGVGKELVRTVSITKK